MNEIKVIDGESQRDAIDVRDRFVVLRAAEDDLRRRFDGAMFHESRGNIQYLLRRRSGAKGKQSLGPRSPDLDRVLAEFTEGKARLEARIKGLRAEIEARAPVLTARGLGRVPVITARVLRRLDSAGWLGSRLHVVGTNALFAYEALAGVRVISDATATGDVDVLFDVRRRVSLGGADVAPQGLVGLLRKVDRSFAPTAPHSFRAVNDKGYLVDLIEPIRGNRTMQKAGRLSDDPDDIHAVAIEGLDWLVNAPKVEAVAFDERGLPVWMPTVDPRVFALHKAWIAGRADRDGAKRSRDRLQARIAARIAVKHLGLSFDDPALTALPKRMIAEGAALAAGIGQDNDADW
jgi:hypothetical protein